MNVSAFTPHGPGFRFIDNFEIITPNKQGRSQFHLQPDLWFFAEHFPGNPIMPAALLVECAAQACGVLWMSLPENVDTAHMTPLFVAGIDAVRVLGPARPGETIVSTVELLKEFGSLAQFQFELATESGVILRGKATLSRQLKG